MDAGIAGEVGRDGLRADVFDQCEFCDCVAIEAEAAEVVGEIQHAIRGQSLHRGAQQRDMRALHVEILGTRRVGERRRIAEHQVVLAPIGLQPLQRIVDANQTPAERKLELFRGRWHGSVDPIFREFAY